MTSEQFLDTPLLYDGKVVNHFIPQNYKGLVKFLEEKRSPPEFENLEEKLDAVLANPLGFSESLQQLVAKNKALKIIDLNFFSYSIL